MDRKLFQLTYLLSSTFFLGYYEFSPKKSVSILPIDILFFYITLIVFIIFLIYQLIKFLKTPIENGKTFTTYILIYSSLFFTIFTFHYFYRLYSDESESLVLVEQPMKVEGRESTIFDFKKNGDLKLSAYFKFSEEYYWGIFKQTGDTLLLNISPDFKIGKKAYFKANKFYFLDDTLNNYTLQIINYNYR